LRGFLAFGTEGWIVVLWAIAPYIIFSTQSSIVHSRYIMPLLPPFGIAIAVWLSHIRPRWLRVTLVTALAIVAIVQLAALSFDALSWLGERLPFYARGVPIQLPASGSTDPDYWVVDDILTHIEADRETDPAFLGVLINTQRVNSKQFIYMVYEEYPHVAIRELATTGWVAPSYLRAFENDYVVLRDPSPDYARRPDARATIERILSSPEDTFHRAFDQAEAYPLPNGTQVILYERHFPTAEAEDSAYYEELMADLAQMAQPGDAVIAVPPEQIYALARHGDGSLPIYPVPRDARPLTEEDRSTIDDLGDQYERVWLVAASGAETDPGGLLPQWLAEGYYRTADRWHGPLQLVLYAAPAGAGETGELQEVAAQWENGISLDGFRIADPALSPGDVIRITLRWQMEEPVSDRYKVFIHLVDGEGRPLSQRDGEPAGNTRPTTTWAPGEVVEDRHGVWVPDDLPEGEYELRLGLYHADTGERLGACCPAGDFVKLATVRARGDQVHVTWAP
jgi:hypothetical protein